MIMWHPHTGSPKMLQANLNTLKEKLPKNTVSLLPISGSDIYYTDGMAINYQYRLEINEGLYLKYSAYINQKEFVSCDLSKTQENTYYRNIIQEWLSVANQSVANQSVANQSAANQSVANQSVANQSAANAQLNNSVNSFSNVE